MGIIKKTFSFDEEFIKEINQKYEEIAKYSQQYSSFSHFVRQAMENEAEIAIKKIKKTCSKN